MSAPFGRPLFVVNPNAGPSGFDLGSIVGSVFGDRLTFTIKKTERAGHAAELVQAALGYHDLIVAVGGDGTLNEVGRALVGSDTPLGILPAGSGNALARFLGIPLDLREACRELIDGRVRSIDVGRVGDDIFLSSAGIGLDAEVCWKFNNRSNGARGLLPYVRYGVHTLLTYEAGAVKLTIDDGSEIHTHPDLLTVANTGLFGYGIEIAPRAVPYDGWLDVCVVEGLTLGRALLGVPRLFNGTFDRAPGVTRHRAREVHIERESGGYYHVDGEAREGGMDLHLTLSEAALKVVVPQR